MRFLVLTALCAASCLADENDWKEKVDVLTPDNFDKFRADNTPALVMFQAPWCGHCKAFKPFYGKAAALAKEHDLKFGMGGVDCDGGGKELCAAEKFNVTSFPTVHFFADKETEPVKYEGARTTKGVKSFIKEKLKLDLFPGDENFVNEPKWEENGNVLHQTDDHFNNFRKENPKMFVMFYAPWCGHCKKFKPVFAEASRKVKAAPMVAVDCTEETEVCKQYGVNAYPTVKMYTTSDGEGEKYTWSGHEDANDLRSYIENAVESAARKAIGSAKLTEKDLRKLRVRVLRKMLKERGLACKGCTDKKEFVKMVLDNQDVKVEAKKHKRSWADEQREKKAREVADAGWDDDKEKAVRQLTDFDWDAFRKEGKPAVVMFYAPWCQHCKDLKPKFAEGAQEVKELMTLGAIDCDTNEQTCGKYKVESFPSLKYFADEKDSGSDYKGGRDKSGFVKFAQTKTTSGVGAGWVGDVFNVKHIEDSALEAFNTENNKFMLMMYSKTCEKCKSAMPKYAQASADAAEAEVTMPFAAADCASDPETCKKFGIKNPKVLRSAVFKLVEGGDASAIKGAAKFDAKAFVTYAQDQDEEPGNDEL